MRNAPRFGVNTYSYIYSHKALDCIKRLSDRGYSSFELMMFPGHFWPDELSLSDRREVRSYLDKNKCHVSTINQPNIDINIAAATVNMRRYSVDIIIKMLELAADIGCKSIIIGPGKANPLFPAPASQLKSWFFSSLDELITVSEKQQVRLLVENMPFSFLPECEGLMKVLDDYGNDEIGVVYDIANSAYIREDLTAGIAAMAGRLKHIHLSDTQLNVYQHAPIGAGVIPFDKFGKYINQMNCSECPILEIVAPEPDKHIDASAQRLADLGWAWR